MKHSCFCLLQDPVEMLGDVYLSDNLADAAQAWNAWRREVVDYAVRDKIVPALLQVRCESGGTCLSACLPVWLCVWLAGWLAHLGALSSANGCLKSVCI